MKIYFIDDDLAINRYHEITLSEVANELNYGIKFFDNPVETLTRFENEGDLPDLIYLDINMPIMDGWEFLEKFRENFPDTKTKIIVISTSNNPNHRAKIKEFDSVISFAIKPLTPDNFKENIEILKEAVGLA